MFWNALAVIVTGLAILITVRQGVGYRLLYDLDHVLAEDLDEISLNLREERGLDFERLHRELDRKARGHAYHQWFVLFIDRKGDAVWSSTGAPVLPRVITPGRETETLTTSGYRLAYRELAGARERAPIVCVGSSVKFIQRDMASIDRMVILVAAVIIVGSPLCGYILAGRATAPLANMMATTARLRPSEMDERLKVRGTGDELDQLAMTVNGLLDRLAEYLKQKHDFLANAAHELRTPLSAIRSSVEVALSGDRTVDEYNELLAEVIDECSSLETLVNQLLLLAETDADRQEVVGDPIPLHLVVGRAAEMFQGVAEFNGVRLKVEHLPEVVVPGNRHYLRQVLSNLLDNAIKFTASRYVHHAGPISANNGHGTRGEIKISLQPDWEQRVVRLLIEDNGPGIPKEDLPLIFDRFYRVDRARVRGIATGGTGLGLSICQAIIHAHRGTIEVMSKVDEGTTFVITLPLVTADNPAALV
ncbi:sensor histidine kinase [Anatilimnocola floriformis]|uniref:sensor histidine kinase n=1 Tax=Anatilimnocola floriformis TaxID=2948575 RepID=UPI0020C310A8|nr:ATP-binding protein [Anatilimnocola floriformis]